MSKAFQSPLHLCNKIVLVICIQPPSVAGEGATPVELKGVWSISVCRLPFQILWQVDNHDGVEGTFLHSIAHA